MEVLEEVHVYQLVEVFSREGEGWKYIWIFFVFLEV